MKFAPPPATKRATNGAIMIKPMTEAKRAYETKRAAKAGMSLDKWLALKAREQQDEERARKLAATPPPAPKPLRRPALRQRVLFTRSAGL